MKTLAFIAAAALLPLPARAMFPAHVRLSDAEMAAMRGGFIAPGGLQVDLRIQLDTLVNGALVLRSVLNPDQPLSTGLQVYAPAALPTGGAQSPAAASTATAATIPSWVSFERSTGVTFGTTNVTVPNVQVSAAAPMDTPTAPRVDVNADGAAVPAAGGSVQVANIPDGARVMLRTDGLQVLHILGANAVNAVANSADNRTIDSTTTIGIGLPNATAFNLGASAARVQDTVLQSARAVLR